MPQFQVLKSLKRNGNKGDSLSKDIILIEGVVTDVHKGTLFTVEYEAGGSKRTLLAKPAGKLKKYNIRLVLGDKVEVEVSPFDLTKGRITFRAR